MKLIIFIMIGIIIVASLFAVALFFTVIIDVLEKLRIDMWIDRKSDMIVDRIKKRRKP